MFYKLFDRQHYESFFEDHSKSKVKGIIIYGSEQAATLDIGFLCIRDSTHLHTLM